MLKLFALIALALSNTGSASPTPKEGFQWSYLQNIAIQERGRIKPFDTFANETLQFLTGKSTWNGVQPTEFVFSMLFRFEDWENEELINISYNPLKEKLGLDKSKRFFSYKAISENTALIKLVQEGARKEQSKERLSELDKKAFQVQNQRGMLEAIISGTALTILPNPQGIDATWFPISAISDRTLPYAPDQLEKLSQSLKALMEAYYKGDSKTWNDSSLKFVEVVRTELGKDHYPSAASLKREIHYNQLRPFRWAWIFYLVSFLALVAFTITQAKFQMWAGAAALALGLAIHTYGFVLRCWIAGRPPVSNMYESVLWVAWGCVVFSLVIWIKYKKAVIPTAAVVFAILGLVLADNVPLVLDPSIHPLEPVLRSNFWLTIHVLTITLSYAAFALSLCLGNVVLGAYLFKPTSVPTIQSLTLYMYRAMQIGVILLAAGTILGGVWADYSWGRFWGWDPKEVWALIALLLYIAVLHGRFTGWLKGFGFVVTTVLSFMGVLMAWYGVNFVLGVGLHSYGFGSGGSIYVSTYLGLQLAYIYFAYQSYQRAKSKHGVEASAIFPK